MIYEALQEVINSTGATQLVFYGKLYNSPMSKSWIEKKLYRTMARAFPTVGFPLGL